MRRGSGTTELTKTMTKAWAIVCLALLCVLASGCTGRGYSGARRFRLSGKVTVDGQPMQMGVISFIPQDKSGRVSGAPVESGAYSVPEENGPTAGVYEVRVSWNKLTGKKIPNPSDKGYTIDQMVEGLPAKYREQSELTAEVSPKQTRFNFELKTK
jgi:hypothetical protein